MIAILAAGLAIAAAEAKPFTSTYKTKYAEVSFSWSSEAAAVPALVRRFRAEFAKEKAKTEHCGKVESQVRIASGGEAIQCESSTKVTTSGETAGLLGLAYAYWAFTGGAHGNGATRGLLWDRKLNKEIKFSALFVSPNAYQGPLRQPYCRALDLERKKRRGAGYVPGSVGAFDECPKFSELTLIPGSSAAVPSLDQIHLIAAPYTAGPYVEGEYDIALPVTPRVIAALKPEYRSRSKLNGSKQGRERVARAPSSATHCR